MKKLLEGTAFLSSWILGLIWGNLFLTVIIWFFTNFKFWKVLLVLSGLSLGFSLIMGIVALALHWFHRNDQTE